MNPGPQCHSCRKRRIRCDSKRPSCHKCIKAKIECPGYGKTFQWIDGPKTRRGRQTASDSGTRQPVSSRDDSGDEQQELAKFETTRGPLSPPPTSWLNDDDSLMMESLHYFNNTICTELTPVRSSASIFQLPPTLWKYYPRLLRQTVVCIAQSVMRIRLEREYPGDSGRGKLVLRHKTEVLSTLNERIGNVRKRHNDITIAAVVMVIMSELCESSTGVWTLHLQGALQLMKLRGGFYSCCLDGLKGAQVMLWTFMMVDAMSATTCPAKLLASEDYLRNHLDYLKCLPSFYETTDVVSWCPCPADVLRAIVLINIQRARAHTGRSGAMASSAGSESESRVEKFRVTETVFNLINNFSAKDWALSAPSRRRKIEAARTTGSVPLSHSRDVEGELEQWALLAETFQSAALIYLIRTLDSKSSVIPAAPYTSSSVLEYPIPDSLAEATQQKLLANLQKLVNTRFENAILWPLIIAGFETLYVVSAVETEQANSPLSFVVENLARISAKIASPCVDQAVKVLQRSRRLALARTTTAAGAAVEASKMPGFWQEPFWDQAFDQRHMLVF